MYHGRKALHWRHRTLLCRLYRAISRRDYDQLRALEPRLLIFAPAWRSKSCALVNFFMICPPVGRWLADEEPILLPITAISWL